MYPFDEHDLSLKEISKVHKKARKFLDEFEKLCKKHKLIMIAGDFTYNKESTISFKVLPYIDGVKISIFVDSDCYKEIAALKKEDKNENI